MIGYSFDLSKHFSTEDSMVKVNKLSEIIKNLLNSSVNEYEISKGVKIKVTICDEIDEDEIHMFGADNSHAVIKLGK